MKIYDYVAFGTGIAGAAGGISLENNLLALVAGLLLGSGAYILGTSK